MRRAGYALGRLGPGFGHGYHYNGSCGAHREDPAVSRRAGPSSSRHGRNRLGELWLLSLAGYQVSHVSEMTKGRFDLKLNISSDFICANTADLRRARF